MRYLKFIIPVVALALWVFNLVYFGINGGANNIQQVDGIVLSAESGVLVVFLPKIIEFFRHHREMSNKYHHLLQRVEHLHDKFDNHIADKEPDK